jgi:SNF2 family DNA or RNA helicase
MQILNDKAILLEVDNPQQVVNLIPKSRIVGDKVAVHWGLEEIMVLRNLGYDVPSPIEGRYKFPSAMTPYEHQVKTAAFLSVNPRAYLLSEQGTGKTASAIWASDYLLKQGRINRVLVVCPLSIMESAWKDDMFKFAMHRTVEVAHGAKEKRRKVLALNTDYVVINYDGIEVIRDDIAAGGFDCIIIDEANHYKNSQTERWKTLNSLVKPDTWLWMMTGTPAAQNPVDAYGLAKMMDPSSVPKYFGKFRDMVMQKITQFKWVPKHNARDTIHNVLQPAIRFTKDQCLDLPPITITSRDVEMTPQQNKYYKVLKNKMVMSAAGEAVTARNAAIQLAKLMQISLGAVYTDEGEVLQFDVTPRYKALKEVMEEANKKVIVFVPFKNSINLVVEKLRKDKISCDIISGEVSASKRSEIFRAFQTSDTPQVLVIQPQAAAHGVTLTAADTIVWWGPTPSLETYLQANARIHRPGQDSKCTIVQLRGSYVERRYYTMLDTRIDFHTGLVDLYKEILD